MINISITQSRIRSFSVILFEMLKLLNTHGRSVELNVLHYKFKGIMRIHPMSDTKVFNEYKRLAKYQKFIRKQLRQRKDK